MWWTHCRASARSCSTTSARIRRGVGPVTAGALRRARRPHEHPPRRGGEVVSFYSFLELPHDASRLHRAGLRLLGRAGPARTDAGTGRRRDRARGSVPRPLRPRAGGDARRRRSCRADGLVSTGRTTAPRPGSAGGRDARRLRAAGGLARCARRSTVTAARGARGVGPRRLRRRGFPTSQVGGRRSASRAARRRRQRRRGRAGTIKDRYVMELRPHLLLEGC